MQLPFESRLAEWIRFTKQNRKKKKLLEAEGKLCAMAWRVTHNIQCVSCKVLKTSERKSFSNLRTVELIQLPKYNHYILWCRILCLDYLHTSYHLILTRILWGRLSYYPDFTGKKIKQRAHVNCTMSHRYLRCRAGQNNKKCFQ